MDLALALKEELLEEVVLLMEMMTILPEGGGSMTRSRSFTAQEWAPAGSEKCLKFLQAAVWVQGEPSLLTAHKLTITVIFLYRRTSDAHCWHCGPSPHSASHLSRSGIW